MLCIENIFSHHNASRLSHKLIVSITGNVLQNPQESVLRRDEYVGGRGINL